MRKAPPDGGAFIGVGLRSGLVAAGAIAPVEAALADPLLVDVLPLCPADLGFVVHGGGKRDAEVGVTFTPTKHQRLQLLLGEHELDISVNESADAFVVARFYGHDTTLVVMPRPALRICQHAYGD
jgi:hypothetical protein